MPVWYIRLSEAAHIRMKTIARMLVECWFFVIHAAAAVLLSTIIGVIAAAVAGLTVGKALALPFPIGRLFFDVPYSPLLWGVALVLGFWLNKRMLNRSAVLVGFVAVFAFFFLVWWDVSRIRNVPYYQVRSNGHYWQYEYKQLIAPSGRCEDECLGRLFFTAPMLNAAAYSAGAWLALRRQRTKATQGVGSAY